jgi:hypothetical protein
VPTNFKDYVFINCPFDAEYKPIFDALFFVVHDAGFFARCALELSDAAQNRFDKILLIIAECKYGIHDISRTELDPMNSLPRFNMPFELGIYLGSKWFGSGIQRTKSCLILDKEPYRYQKFISDITGQDIYSHHNKPEEAIGIVRNWLRTESKRVNIPGKAMIEKRFNQFLQQLPHICQGYGIQVEELTLADFTHFVTEWLKGNVS